MAAVVLVFTISVLFLFVGHVNALSPIVIMPFLLTYAAVNYAYFALAMSPGESRNGYERLTDDSNVTVNIERVEEEVDKREGQSQDGWGEEGLTEGDIGQVW